jgi:hypothetical protein
MKTLEVTAKYKLGHAHFKAKTTVAVRNLNYIQEVPEEVPEEVPDHADGIRCRIQMPTGEYLPVIESYAELSAAYTSAMVDEG